MTTQEGRREDLAPQGKAEQVKQWASRRLRAADRLRMEYVEAVYTPIGQRALVMFSAALMVLLVNLGVLGALLFL